MINFIFFIILVIAVISLAGSVSSLRKRLSVLERKVYGTAPPPTHKVVTQQPIAAKPKPTFVQTPAITVAKSTDLFSHQKEAVAKKIRAFLTTRNVIALVGGLLLIFGEVRS